MNHSYSNEDEICKGYDYTRIQCMSVIVTVILVEVLRTQHKYDCISDEKFVKEIPPESLEWPNCGLHTKKHNQEEAEGKQLV